jgi:hypothetical protein
MAKRVFERPKPGSDYTAEQRAAWGREQDRLRAERALQPKPTPPKRASRATELKADTSGSSCFSAAKFKNGVLSLTFANPTVGTWEYEISRAEAKEFFDSESLGGWFNDNLR